MLNAIGGSKENKTLEYFSVFWFFIQYPFVIIIHSRLPKKPLSSDFCVSVATTVPAWRRCSVKLSACMRASPCQLQYEPPIVNPDYMLFLLAEHDICICQQIPHRQVVQTNAVVDFLFRTTVLFVCANGLLGPDLIRMSTP